MAYNNHDYYLIFNTTNSGTSETYLKFSDINKVVYKNYINNQDVPTIKYDSNGVVYFYLYNRKSDYAGGLNIRRSQNGSWTPDSTYLYNNNVKYGVVDIYTSNSSYITATSFKDNFTSLYTISGDTKLFPSWSNQNDYSQGLTKTQYNNKTILYSFMRSSSNTYEWIWYITLHFVDAEISFDETYNLSFYNNQNLYDSITISGASTTGQAPFTSISQIQYGSTTVYSNGSWVSGYSPTLYYNYTAPTITTLNTDCNSLITFTTARTLQDTNWIFRDTIPTYTTTSTTYNINFASRNTSYTSLEQYVRFYTSADENEGYLKYDNTMVCNWEIPVLYEWAHDDYKIINITGGSDATNAALIAWLENTATQQLPSQPSISIGTLSINKLYYGSTEVSGLYFGNVKIYEKTVSGYQVTISFAQGDRVDGINIYDGQDTAGRYIGYAEHEYNDPAASYTYTVSSGYMYFDPDSNWYNGVTCSENIINHSQGSTSSSSGYGLFEILGDGTISNFEVACFAKGTQISLADGKTKNVEDITYNDLLLVWNFYEAKLDAAKPCWICRPGKVNFYWLVKLSDNTELKLVGKYGHRLFNVDKQQMLYCVDCVGDRVYKQDGSIVTVLSCEQVFEEVEYYNLTTDVHLDCFANEVLTGSRLNNMYKIEDMKYVDRNRLISVKEEQERWEHRWKLKLEPTE